MIEDGKRNAMREKKRGENLLGGVAFKSIELVERNTCCNAHALRRKRRKTGPPKTLQICPHITLQSAGFVDSFGGPANGISSYNQNPLTCFVYNNF